MAINKVYTKTGDDGTTSLIGGLRVKKTNSRIEAYGTVDELSAQLGLLVSFMKDGDDKNLVVRSQRNLFTVSAYLATDTSKTPLAPSYTLDPSETERLEQAIDKINASIPQQKNFILPGGSHEAAVAHVCRTVCRRAERAALRAAAQHKVDADVLIYLNRLSDYFYVLGRAVTVAVGAEEILWIP